MALLLGQKAQSKRYSDTFSDSFEGDLLAKAYWPMAVATVLALFAAVQPAQAAFPGKNGKIAFTSFRDDNNEIYTMNPDGTKQTNISDNTADDSLPAVSPDGKKIAFERVRSGNRDIFRMNSDGSKKTRLTKNPAADLFPDWG